MTAASGTVLETERLVLRRLAPGDLPALHALDREPVVRRCVPDGTRTLEVTREKLEWFLHGHPRFPELGLWATIERATGGFLGRSGLPPWTIDRTPEVELTCLIDPANAASVRVAEYVGLRFERQRVDEHGPYAIYARSRPDPDGFDAGSAEPAATS